MDTERKEIEMYDPNELGTYSEGGRGRKQCQCGKYVGAKTRECPACKFKFPIKSIGRDLISTSDSVAEPVKKQYPEKKVEKESKVRYRERNLYFAAGLCPVKLGEMTPSISSPKNAPVSSQELYEWANKLIDVGLAQGVRYLPSALKYYLRHFYDMYSPLWKEAVGMLESYYPEKVKLEEM